MIEIKINERANGYSVEISGGIKYNGVYVFRSVDILTMLTFIGNLILGRKVRIEEE